MARPNIKDLADAAGVSVSTVNRVIHTPERVREGTVDAVHAAAEEIGFYGLRAMKAKIAPQKQTIRIGIQLLQQNRAFYHTLADEILAAAGANTEYDVRVQIEYLNDLAPENVANSVRKLSTKCDVVGLVASEHPIISDAIQESISAGTPIFSLISPLSSTRAIPYIGLDNYKVGRTAAWAIDNICHAPGKIGTLVGSHRYRSQELNETGFRSYFREHPRGFTLLEPLSTLESSSLARELVENLLNDHPDLTALFISGGGITGALKAVENSGRGKEIVVVGYERMDLTRMALISGLLNVVISHRIDELARTAIQAMLDAALDPTKPIQLKTLEFDILTPENI